MSKKLLSWLLTLILLLGAFAWAEGDVQADATDAPAAGEAASQL